MLREHLIPHGFVTALHYPPMRFQEKQLRELFVEVSGMFGFPDFSLLPNGAGASFRNGKQKTCEISNDRLIIKDFPAEVTYDEYLEGALKMVDVIRQRLNPPLWIVQQSILRFLVPLGEPVVPVLRNSLFRIDDEALAQLERPVHGFSLRLEMPPVPDHQSQVQLRIEPYYQDLQMIYLEAIVRHLAPLPAGQDLRPRLEEAYSFVKHNALSFLQGCLPERQ